MEGFKKTCGVGLVIILVITSSFAWGQVLKPLSGTQGAESIDGGVGQFHQRNWKSAAEKFQSALKKNPHSAVAHYNLGLTLRNMGLQDKASDHFRKASKYGTSNPFIQNSPEVKQALEPKKR